MVFLLFFAAYVNADVNAELEILPIGETQTKPVGSNIVLTCKMNNMDLVTDMKWLDPHGHEIDGLK